MGEDKYQFYSTQGKRFRPKEEEKYYPYESDEDVDEDMTQYLEGDEYESETASSKDGRESDYYVTETEEETEEENEEEEEEDGY